MAERGDLIRELKDRLKLEDLIQREAEFQLKSAGAGRLVGVTHDSFHVNTAEQIWSWFSQGPRAGQKALGGDVLDWIAYRKAGRLCRELSKEEFVEIVLREACALAGLDFEATRGTGDKTDRTTAAARRREVEEILELYVRAAEKARDGDASFYARVVLPVMEQIPAATEHTEATEKGGTGVTAGTAPAVGGTSGRGPRESGGGRRLPTGAGNPGVLGGTPGPSEPPAPVSPSSSSVVSVPSVAMQWCERVRKPYLTKEVCQRWRIGLAPTLAQCSAEGLTERELRLVGLLRDPPAERAGGRSYLHFRDRFIIPFLERGRVVYLAGRAFRDATEEGQEIRKLIYLPKAVDGDSRKDAKTQRTEGEEERLPRGVEAPAGFNLEVLGSAAAREKGVLLVEGPLDSIGACEQGEPATALLRSSVSAELARRVKACGVAPYLALDSTADVTREKRCRVSAAVGSVCRICELPAGKDPDELSGVELAEVKRAAKPVLSEWLAWAGGLEPVPKRVALKELAGLIADWVGENPAAAGEIRAECRKALKLSVPEYRAWLKSEHKKGAPKAHTSKPLPEEENRTETADRTEKKAEAGGVVTTGVEVEEGGARKPSTTSNGDNNSSGAGPPVGLPTRRGAVRNFEWVNETVDGEPKKWMKACALDVVIGQIQELFHGQLFRLRAPGAKDPQLFTPDGEGGVILIPGATALASLVGLYAQVKFNGKQDPKGTNFHTWGEVYQALGLWPGVREYRAIGYYPHEPPMKDVYYVWRPPKDYAEGDGRYLERALALFDNIREPSAQALFVAALVTPFWGGPCGRRPCFVFHADDVGYGKGAAANLVGAGCGGPLQISMGKQAEERWKVRLLSPEGMKKRVVDLDNVKGTLDSNELESLITQPEVSGHRLNIGEASRPNDLTTIITANDAHLSPDMTRRTFFVRLEEPIWSPEWDEQYEELQGLGERFVVDALSVLRSARPKRVEFGEAKETNKLWLRDVLARVLTRPFVRELAGDLTVREVVEANHRSRVVADEALERAKRIERGIIEHLVKRENLTVMSPAGLVLDKEKVICVEGRWQPQYPIFLPSKELAQVMQNVENRKEINVAWAARTLNRDIKAKRVLNMERDKDGDRGFVVQPEAFAAYLAEVAPEKGGQAVQGTLGHEGQ